MPRHRGNSRWWPASGDRSSTASGSRATSQAPTSGGEISSRAPWKVRTGHVDRREVEPGLELALDVVRQPLACRCCTLACSPADERLDGARAPGRARARPTLAGQLQDVLARDRPASIGSGTR